MQPRTCRMDDFGHLGDRLDRPGLVVGGHHRDQRRRAGSQHGAQMIEIDDARAGDGDGADRFGGKSPAREHRGVLDRRHHEPLDRLA